MNIETFKIDSRFRGPPRSGNGGYTCGRIAKHLQGAVTVRLKAAPPLETELRLESTESDARLFHDTTLVGEGKRSQLDLRAEPCPPYEAAEHAAESFVGFRFHRLPGCFVCGPERTRGDGLRIFPGSVGGTSTYAAPWTPDPSLGDESDYVRPELLWSALDCTGAFALMPMPDDVLIVLGELTASITGRVKVGDPCVVLGWPLGTDGRKRMAGTAVYAPGGSLVALARAVWIEVPLRTWT